MNPPNALSFARARNGDGEFAQQDETTPGSMARAYLPLRYRLIGRAADRRKNRVAASNTTVLDRGRARPGRR